EEKQIVLALDGSTPMLSGDRAMLRRAISNLLSNALRYTPAGQTINVKLKKTDDAWVELRVENPGLKIPPEHLPKIFDRFYRVDPSRQRLSEGAGLGLAIVKSIVEAHGGHLDAFSDDGITRFSIRLPLVTKDIDA
ncbi:ATP-binding protein, partial [Zhongshania aliphaticivorans]|uniref:ATP-binding protein n=1 Tax=Zhongshania aliphaticivorans TaxID=1470434 RepID=UPI0039C8FA62